MRWPLAVAFVGFLVLGSLLPVATQASDCLYNVEWAPCWGGFRYSHVPSAQPVIVPVSVPMPVYQPVYVPRISPAVYAPPPYAFAYSNLSPYRAYRPWHGYGSWYPPSCFSCGFGGYGGYAGYPMWYSGYGGYGAGGINYVSPSFGFSIGF